MADKLLSALAPALARHRAGAVPDDELVGRYATARDEEAFAELVRRHGGMVQAVCRRVVRNAADADDVFQATFLVLARKAGEIRPPGAVGAWLHGVAFRTAREAVRRTARRREKESRVPPREPIPEPLAADVRPILDAELARLPEKFAQVLVLCDMEGQSRGDAAALLRVPEGTVASRLARAREALAARLTRRGVGLGVGALAALLAEDARATAPADQVAVAVRALNDAASPSAVSLANAVLAPRVTFLAVGLVVVGMAVAGWAATGAPRGPDQPATVPAPAPKAQAVADPAAALRERFVGAWQVDDGTREGRALTDWEKSGFTFHFGTAGGLTIHRGTVRDQRAFTWAIDAKATPPVMVWTPTGEPDRPIRVPFEMRDKELVLMWDEPAAERGRRAPTAPAKCRVVLSKAAGPAGAPAVVASSRSAVGARLAGVWVSDAELNVRLGKPAAAQRLTFVSDPSVTAEVPDTFRGLFAGKSVHDAGRVTVGGVVCRFLLVEHHGDARLVFFVPAKGDEWACEETATVALVPGAAGEKDLLFLTPAESAKVAPTGAFRRAPTGK
jgi:RNA polymerase sigma factor (sigma-70 family)